MSRLLLLACVTCAALLGLTTSAAAGRPQPLPASFVVLPLASFADAALVAAYDCEPVLGFYPCSGHGQCHLLLDSSAQSSQPFLNASTAQPVPASDTSLDPVGLYADSALPVAVCLCDSGWTGRGDYISHYATDGDSCGVSQSVVLALSSVSIAEFAFVLLLALNRLWRWYAWHVASVADSDTAALAPAADGDSEDHISSTTASKQTPPALSPGKHHSSAPSASTTPVQRKVDDAIRVFASAAATKPHRTSSRAIDAPSTPVRGASTPPPASGTPTALARASRGHLRSSTHGVGQLKGHGRGASEASVSVAKTRSQKRQLLHSHLAHITFLHPLLSAAVAVLGLAYFVLRIDGQWTIGQSYGMSALMYGLMTCYLLACSVAVLNTLRAASVITRTKTGAKGLSNVNRWAKRCLTVLCIYASLTEALVFLARAYNSQQQLLAQLNLCFCFTPITALGLVSVVATRRITHALVQHLGMLSAQQQEDRLATCRKLRQQANVLIGVCVCTAVPSFTLAFEPHIRQSGLPYFALVIHTCIALTLISRLLLLRSHIPQRATVAPAPATQSTPTPLNRLLTAANDVVASNASKARAAVGTGRPGAAGGVAGADGGGDVSVLVRSPGARAQAVPGKGEGEVGGVSVGRESSSRTRCSSNTASMKA